MSAFWGGFAGKGVEYIDEARKNSLDKAKLDDARKFETTEWDRRNAINRQEKLEDDSLRDMRDNYFKPERIIKDEDGKHWYSKMEQDSSGNWVWTREEASAAQIAVADKEAKAARREDVLFGLEVTGKDLSNQRTRQSLSLDARQDRREAEAHALEMGGGGKSRAKRDKTSVESFIESLAKNDKVVYAGSQPTAAHNGKAAGFTVTERSQKNANLVRDILGDPRWKGRYNKLSLRAIAQLAEEGDAEASVVISEVAPYLTFLD